MSRITAFAVAFAVALGAPLVASAATKQYGGAFEGSPANGTLSFGVKKAKRGKKVVRFRFADVAISCDGGQETTTGRLTFAIPVKRKQFDANAVRGDPRDPDAELRLSGTLKGKRNAAGTMRVRGRAVPIDPPRSGESDNCDSGVLDWRAKRG